MVASVASYLWGFMRVGRIGSCIGRGGFPPNFLLLLQLSRSQRARQNLSLHGAQKTTEMLGSQVTVSPMSNIETSDLLQISEFHIMTTYHDILTRQKSLQLCLLDFEFFSSFFQSIHCPAVRNSKMSRSFSSGFLMLTFVCSVLVSTGECAVCSDNRCTCSSDKTHQGITAVCRMSDLENLTQSLNTPREVYSL